MGSDLACFLDPWTILIFYGIYVVASPANNGGQMEKLGVLITHLKPQFSRFLPPQSFTSEEPFQKVGLKVPFY